MDNTLAVDKRCSLHRRRVLQRYKKMKGCEICGYNKTAVGLQFDHLDPTIKTRDKRHVTQFNGMSWARLKKELSNCRVLCATCHMEKTYQDIEWDYFKDYPKRIFRRKRNNGPT